MATSSTPRRENTDGKNKIHPRVALPVPVSTRSRIHSTAGARPYLFCAVLFVLRCYEGCVCW